MSQMLSKAREYERAGVQDISEQERPKFHMTPQIGWMNDPNGFSFYQGEYHLFYQSNPYDVHWDSMHWGHAVSRDLLHWSYLPCALAPDQPYDAKGVFSGTAVTLNDGRQMLIYTGVHQEAGESGKDLQAQCIAVGDGVDYRKYEKNPVVDASFLPDGLSPYDFRDPKIWREADGSYRFIAATRKPDAEGSILLFRSEDGFSWKFESVLITNDGTLGMMWECPDFFELDGKHILQCSPMDMTPDDGEYQNVHGTICLIGELDESGEHFTYDCCQPIDYGTDFYAPQTILSPDGRRIMIGWMQNWDACDAVRKEGRKWFSQMTLPRELFIKDGRMYQAPIRELEAIRSGEVSYREVEVSGACSLTGIEGRIIDLELTIRPAEENRYRAFTISFAENAEFHTTLTYTPADSVLRIDRKSSGLNSPEASERSCRVRQNGGLLKLRMILDRYSAEVFVNDGEQVMSAVIPTTFEASNVTFHADGMLRMDVTKYDLTGGI